LPKGDWQSRTRISFGCYEKVREDGAVRSQAVLIAIGIKWEDGGTSSPSVIKRFY
jgi:transposase-like protein